MRYIFRIETNLDDTENEALMVCMLVDIVGMVPSPSITTTLLRLCPKRLYVLNRYLEQNNWIIPANLFSLCRPYTTVLKINQVRSKTFEVEVL